MEKEKEKVERVGLVPLDTLIDPFFFDENVNVEDLLGEFV